MADNENDGPDPSHAGDALAYSLGALLPSPRPIGRELMESLKFNLTPPAPDNWVADVCRRVCDRAAAKIEAIPAGAFGYIIGIDPASPEGDISVRFLYEGDVRRD